MTSLETLQNENPKLFCGVDTLSFERDPTGPWYEVQFCYDNKIVKTLIRAYGKQATLALVSLSNKDDSNIKLINRDFGFWANRSAIQAFENNVVHALHKDQSSHRVLSVIVSKIQR